MEYIAALIALAATCLGICGETWNKKGRGFRKVTALGYATLVLATGACSVAVFQVRSARSTEISRGNEAVEILADTAQQIVTGIMSERAMQPVNTIEQSCEDLTRRLNLLGARLGRILDLYRDVLPDRARKSGWQIHVVTTELASQTTIPGLAEDYLRGLDSHLRELFSSLNLPAGHSRLPDERLDKYVLDFVGPWPDPSLK